MGMTAPPPRRRYLRDDTGLSFFGRAPLATQPAHPAQARLVNNTGGSPSATNIVPAIVGGVLYSQSDMQAVKAAIATIIEAVNAHRDALVALGLEKGSG